MAEPKRTRLPPKSEDKVIDVSLKHVAFGFAVLLIGTALAGAAVFAIRDYSRYRRQKAIVESLKDLFVTLSRMENNLWKEKKTAG